MATIQKTTGSSPLPRVDFDQKMFTDLIQQKGKEVIIEKAHICPCKSPSTNAQSNCQNCGGTGWIFVNPTTTRMVMQNINLVNDFAPWSEENRGFVNISFDACEELSYLDKITDVNGRAIFSQVLFFKEATDTTIFTYTTYPIKEIKYVGLFKGVSVPLQKLVLNVDYTFQNNVITLINQTLIQNGNVEDTNITVRYKHSPVFHLVEMKRETMETFEFINGSERLKHMPLSAIARRAHYIPNIENLTGNRLLNNNYTESMCNIFVPNQMKYLPIHYVFTDTAATYTNIQLIGKLIMLFRNGVLDTQYTLDLLTGTITPTYSYQANEYIDIYIWGAAS